MAKGEAGTGVGSSNQATPPQVLAGLPVDLSVKARLRALEQVAPGTPGPELTLRERYFQSSAYTAKWPLSHPGQVGNKDQAGLT